MRDKPTRDPGSVFGILRASYFVGFFIILTKLLVVARDLIVAWTFGRSQLLEAFILAYLIPFSLTNALSSSLNITFIPRFIRLREEGRLRLANTIYSNLFGVLLFLSGAIVLIIALGSSVFAPLVTIDFADESISLLKILLFITAPAAMMTAVADLWKGILEAKSRFLESACISIITPAITIGLLVMMPDLGVSALAYGILVGILIELPILALILNSRGLNVLPGADIFSLNLKIQIKQWWRVVLSLTLYNSMNVINSAMATGGSQAGGLSILNYAKKIVTLPNDIAALTYTTVLIPDLSRLAAAKRWNSLLSVLNRWLLLIAVSTGPFVLLIYFWSNEIVKLLYQRGAFSAVDSVNVAIVLRFYVVQIPFFVAFFIMLRVLAVIRRNHAILVFSALGVVLTVLFNILMLRWIGVAGIAISSSLVYVCLSISVYIFIRQSLRSRRSR